MATLVESGPKPVHRADSEQGTVIYRVGGWAALTVVVIVLVNGVVLMFNPIPSTVLGHFQQIEQNKLVGLVNLDLVMLVSQLLAVPIFVALYAALRRASYWLAGLGLGVALAGAFLYLAVNPTFSFLYLSDQYAAAATAAQRAAYLAAGEALWANYQGSAFGLSYLMAAFAMLIISAAMLRTRLFGRLTAYVGLVVGAATLVPPLPAVGTVGVVASYLSLLPMMVFEVLVAWRLLHLAGRSSARTSGPRLELRPAGSA